MSTSFSASNAFAHLEAQCSFGPRNPGSEGHAACLDFLVQGLARLADHVYSDPFSFQSRRIRGSVLHGTNVHARFRPRRKRGRILLCAHWDCRDRADRDANPENRTKPVPGANDGASGVAVLLELASLFARHRPPVGVDIVLFDLEDQGDEGFYEGHPDADPYCIGSTYYAQRLGRIRPEFGVLVDMVGARRMKIGREGYSVQHAPDLVDDVFAIAERLGADAFTRTDADAMVDDHLPLLKAGVPVINLIDQGYPHWHTLEDTPDKCEPNSLRQVGEVLAELVYGGR